MNNTSTPQCATIQVMVSMLPCLSKERLRSFLPSKFSFLTLVLLIFLPLYNNVMAQAYCTMICNDEVSVSVGLDCEATILYDMVLEDGDNPLLCSPNGKWGFKIAVFDEYDIEIPTSPTITFDYVGRTLKAKAKHWATGNICWTTINMVDKVFPKLTCPNPVTVSCTASNSPDRTGYPTAIDCSELNYTFTDNFTDLNCGDPLAQIDRRWTVEDGSGNRDYCTQRISIVQPSLNEVVFPQNLDGFELPPLECEWVAADPASILPEFTGSPRINGKAIERDGPCRLIPSYIDDVVESCEGTYKILRSWKVVNWCTSKIVEEIQIIKVVDSYGPVITVPNDITFSTDNTECEAMLTIPPATVVDGCSETVRVSVQTNYGNLTSNGGSLQNVPVGVHTATYIAEDACGNTSSKDLKIHVIDDDPPTLICEDQTIISLTTDGESSAYTQSFDNGTFDNCCLEGLGIRRMDSEDATYGNTVTFGCQDVGNIVMVVMEARDCYGNANTCMVEVSVQDKVAPSITCPVDQTLDCDIDKNDLSSYGVASGEDNCGFELDYEEVDQLDNCGKGTILRTWTATDRNGRTNTCTQTLSLNNISPWNANEEGIVWPKDWETSECIEETSFEPADLPAGYGEPEIVGANTCALIASNYEDLVLEIEEPACYKILRTWTVIDWCNYNVDYPEQGGIFTHTQIIKVVDNINPIFETSLEDLTADASGSNCGATILLPAATAKDCSNNVTVTVSGDLGSGYGPFNGVEPGNYQMTYTATDGCGNFTSEEITITVTDLKKPTPVCLSGIAVTVMPGSETTDPMIELWAVDLNQKSFDNCTYEEDVHFTIRFYDPLATAAPTSENLQFTCDHLGVQAVEMWVTDAAGNSDFCITSVIVQDNMNACGTQYTEEEEEEEEEVVDEYEEEKDEEEVVEEYEEEEVVEEEQMVAVGGKILTATGQSLNNVEVTISHPDKGAFMTKDDGAFLFDDIPTKEGYTLAPYKNDQPLNGVTTYDLLVIRKHILKIESMESPYQLIAADINRSGQVTTFDLVELQKLILEIYEEIPNNTSWRFVVGDYEFESIVGAAGEDFPESYLLQDLADDMMDLNFVAIKIGDVNNSAVINGLQQSSSRNTTAAVALQIQNQSFEKGELVKVELTNAQFLNMTGFQFALQYDEQILEFNGVGVVGSLTMDETNFGLNQLSKGVITTSWNNPYGEKIAASERLFELNFIAKQKGNLADLLKVDENKMPAEIYTLGEKTHPIELEVIEEADETKGLQLFQNQPNPFQATTTISFYLPKSETIELAIYDALGATIKVVNGTHSKGVHSIELSTAMLPNGGLYYYTLVVGDKRLSKKMLVIK